MTRVKSTHGRRANLPARLCAKICFTIAVLSAVMQTAQAESPPGPAILATDSEFVDSGAAQLGSVPMFSTGPERVLPVMYPEELSKSVAPTDEPSAVSTRPPGSKPGVFQQITFTTTYLPRLNGDLGMTDVQTTATFGFPFPTAKSPLVITPAFEAHWLDGPSSPTDLPPQLYDGSVQFRYLRKLSERWGMDLGIAPGWHGDWEAGSGRAFRTPARAILAWDYTPEMQWIAGIAYLDREDVDFLPVAGVIWSPNEDTRLELIVPRPKIARRVAVDGNIEEWLYLAGEFGGGSYGITRASGLPDVATLSDWRLIFGWERKAIGGINMRLEAGYVFFRNVQYLTGTPELDPDDTFMARAGVWY